MISKRIKIFTFTMITIFIATALYFAISLIAINSKESKNSTSNFETITKKITLNAENYGLLTTPFIESTNSLLNMFPYLSGITISKNNESFYAFPINSPVIFSDQNGNAVISAKSATVKVYTKSVHLQNGEEIVFNVAFNTILPDEIYSIGRRSFIIVLTGTLISLCILIYLAMFENKETPEDEDDFDEFDDYEEYNEFNDEFDDAPTIIIEDGDDEFQDFDDELDNLDSELSEIANKEDNSTVEETTNQIAAEPKLTEKEDPMGLFSAVSGFGWEQYLEPRLDSELIRATSSEQDVSLFVINIPNLQKTSDEANKIYKVIFDFFKFRDMIFEYQEDCIAGIMVNVELEKALDFAEELYIKLDWLIRENKINSKIGIGISSRTLRLIPGERLLSEAYQASIKALDEEVLPIVAFRVNAEQYKDYITENL